MLDGDLGDDCWAGAAAVALRDAAGATAAEYETKVWLAYDDEYLFVALNCKHPVGRAAAPVPRRQRDADVAQQDRVGLLLDLDRDYQTYFHFQIDQRGAVADDCWGDRTWNPRWLVAHKVAADGWTAEFAVPLAELTGDAVTVGKAWAANVIRVLPGRGVQALSPPADAKPRPEGLGLLLFTDAAKAKP
jgi:hypothetical protein